MPVFAGNASTSALSTAFNIPTKIKSFSLVNKPPVLARIVPPTRIICGVNPRSLASQIVSPDCRESARRWPLPET